MGFADGTMVSDLPPTFAAYPSITFESCAAKSVVPGASRTFSLAKVPSWTEVRPGLRSGLKLTLPH